MKRHRLIYLSPAESDVNAILDYYGLEGNVLQDMFLADLEDSEKQIVQFPESSPARGKFRRKLLSRFPYSVIYTVKPDEILVVRVFHTSRRPESWRGRQAP